VTAKGKANRAARGSEVGWLGRAGLAAKGVSFGIVAVLALQVAFGDETRSPKDRQGALQAVASEPLGTVLLVLLAIGFAAYAIWRFAEALFDRDDEGDDAKGVGKRVGKFARGALYVGLCVLTITILLGSNSGSSSENEDAARVLDLPGGRYIVALIGLGVVAAAIFNGYRAITGKFFDDLDTGDMDVGEKPAYRVLGFVGHGARAVVFALIGFFVLKTAWQYDPKEAIGLDGALRKLANEPHGAIWLGIVAAGLGAYGLFCLVQARYRRV
jgi:hypothetical protein